MFAACSIAAYYRKQITVLKSAQAAYYIKQIYSILYPPPGATIYFQ